MIEEYNRRNIHTKFDNFIEVQNLDTHIWTKQKFGYLTSFFEHTFERNPWTQSGVSRRSLWPMLCILIAVFSSLHSHCFSFSLLLINIAFNQSFSLALLIIASPSMLSPEKTCITCLYKCPSCSGKFGMSKYYLNFQIYSTQLDSIRRR